MLEVIKSWKGFKELCKKYALLLEKFARLEPAKVSEKQKMMHENNVETEQELKQLFSTGTKIILLSEVGKFWTLKRTAFSQTMKAFAGHR